ncbi:HC-23 domain-containing protein [Cryptosporidium ubiquitum]|uniref:HC-23 domain-containing protein n=1 Tax=Cryptosporidium ubiquitum TaxID=857276 RepID=A0A1J4MK51_9CRYT|nr:HC-23 domain-containing protein [Cryptosporidium ubiquitum]OII74600.1 HC-23 domain-containing protein [Cryptosporidium ubiquitum]
MDTDSANDTFLWSLTEIENDCSLCLRQIGISNNIPGVVLPCCQQVVCEDCYKDELINKNNGSCPFCFFKGNNKGHKSSMSINNPGMSMNGVINTVNPTAMASVIALPNGSGPNANCLSSVGSGLPLDLSCWLPQNLTAICNPGFQSNNSSTCATSPYYKSNSTSAGEGFNQDGFIYMRGNPIPGVVCGVNSINVGVGTSNVNVQNSQPSPFGVLNDGFWNNSHNSVALQNNATNHNATGSSTNGSFISDPWMSTSSGYSPSNGFLHDFNSYDNNINNSNLNPNMNCSNTEGITDTSANINHIKQCNSGVNSLMNNMQNSKIINVMNNLNETRNSIIETDKKVCDLINEGNKDNLYQPGINVSTFNSAAPNLVNISNNNTSDIYQNNSIYTWTIQNPMACNSIHSFNQVNNHSNMISSATSVDVDFQRFCLGLGFDINSQNQVIGDSQNKNILINDHIHNVNICERNNRGNVNGITLGSHHNIKSLDNSESTCTREGDGISVESGVNETYINGSNLTENKLENRDLQIGSNMDNHLININESGTSSNLNNSINDTNTNSQLFNNSAFPPLTSALIKQIPSSKDSTKISNNASNASHNNVPNTVNSQHNECLNSSNSPKLSNASISGSNQNINNNNPSTGSNPKLISMMGVRNEGSIRNNLNIGSALSTNNSKQNTISSGKAGVVVNLNISTGNVSYIDAVLHKNDSGGGGVTTTSSSTGRSENQASINSDISNISNDSSGNLLAVNTDEDSSAALGAQGEPYNYKRALCRHWMRGYCWLEADCKFAHGEAELRTRDGKLRHPTLSTGGTEVSGQNQGQPQSQAQSQYQTTTQLPNVNNVTIPSGNLAATSTSTSSTFTSSSTSGGSNISSIQSKGLKQQSGNSKNGGNASYAATAASSLTSTVLNSDSNISYSVMVVSGASNLDSKR